MSVEKYFMQNIINNKGLEKEVNLKRYETYPVWIIYLCWSYIREIDRW